MCRIDADRYESNVRARIRSQQRLHALELRALRRARIRALRVEEIDEDDVVLQHVAVERDVAAVLRLKLPVAEKELRRALAGACRRGVADVGRWAGRCRTRAGVVRV